MDDPTPARDLPKLIVRLPEDAKLWLRDEARRNASSQNSEVVRAIRERMARQGGAVPALIAAAMEG